MGVILRLVKIAIGFTIVGTVVFGIMDKKKPWTLLRETSFWLFVLASSVLLVLFDQIWP